MALTRREAHVIAATRAVEAFRSRAVMSSAYPGSREDLEMAFRLAISNYDVIMDSIVMLEEEP